MAGYTLMGETQAMLDGTCTAWRGLRLFVLFLLFPTLAAHAEWFPVSAVVDGKPGIYQPLPRAVKSWRICVLLPHARDKYWWSVSWGIMQEAERLGVRVGIYQAGGYQFLDVQKRQFTACLDQKADAIILGAISGEGLNSDIEQAVRQGVPVIDLVNGVSSKAVAARSLVNFSDMSGAALRYLLADAGSRPAQMLWLPGPKDASWVADAEVGLRQGLQAAPQLRMVHGGYGPTDATSQMSLVRTQFNSLRPDYVMGNAVASEAAANYQHYIGKEQVRIISLYATEPVVELIRQGRVLAAPSDGTVLQARISMDLAVRVLEKKAYARRVAPAIEMLDRASIPHYDFSRLLAPPFERFTQRPLPPR